MNSTSSSDGRILVLEPEEQLGSAILGALHEAAPDAGVDRAASVEDAQRLSAQSKPDLFVLDVDATNDFGQEFLYDLRTSHPNARAIILTGVHLADARERTAGIGAIHFLEKPFPHGDFVDLVQALLRPADQSEEKFQGTLSDLHVADIIQLKCMSGVTGAVEFTAPGGEKGRVYFEKGQIRHAEAGRKKGMEAFQQIASWKGGKILEVRGGSSERTINLDWQMLLMETARQADEAAARPKLPARRRSGTGRILVIDDSLMLLSFVREILMEANYPVSTAPSAAEAFAIIHAELPSLVLLDYVLPDMKGDEIARKFAEDPATADIPIVYMSGFGTDLRLDPKAHPNVIGSLNKPFTSDLLIKTVETHMPKSPDESPEENQASVPEAEPMAPEPLPASFDEPLFPESSFPESSFAEPATPEPAPEAQPAVAKEDEWWSAPATQEQWAPPPAPTESPDDFFATAAGVGTAAAVGAPFTAPQTAAAIDESELPTESVTGGAYFCGDTRFFSLNWALQAIAKEKLTGTLRCYWTKEPIEVLARNGEIVLATTKDPELYCSEAPITLSNVDQNKIAEAKTRQRETGTPMFTTLSQNGSVLQDTALQLVQHHGQKVFAHLWTAPRVRFIFEPSPALPPYANDIPSEGDVDHWALATLRLVQLPDLGNRANYDPGSIPGYTRDGFERVQNLRLTVAETQFGSQFNGVRSVQQIAKNLRLDLKFARLTLFRFIALEIVELWPPTAQAKPEPKGMFSRLGRTLGMGD